MYLVSDQSFPLANLKVDEAAVLPGVHPTMVDEAKKFIARHNRAIDLMLGIGEFTEDWEQLPTGEDGAVLSFDPGAVGPLLDSICSELRRVQAYDSMPDAELIGDRVARIAAIDANHPVVRHGVVLAQRCNKSAF